MVPRQEMSIQGPDFRAEDQHQSGFVFNPAEAVTRNEMAIIFEDLLIKLTGNRALATAYLENTRSPFPDVSPSFPYFHAVMNVTHYGIMETELSGEFRPNDAVEGVEALQDIRTLARQANLLVY